MLLDQGRFVEAHRASGFERRRWVNGKQQDPLDATISTRLAAMEKTPVRVIRKSAVRRAMSCGYPDLGALLWGFI